MTKYEVELTQEELYIFEIDAEKTYRPYTKEINKYGT